MTIRRVWSRCVPMLCRSVILWLVPLVGVAAVGLQQDSASTIVRFEPVLKTPVKHSLTRAAAMHSDGRNVKILFSTHEGYHQSSEPDVTQLVSWDVKREVARKHELAGSAELRSAAYWAQGRKWVFAAALDTALYLYDPDLDRVEKLPAKIPWGGWIHGLGIHGNSLAASASGPGNKLANRGILRLDLQSGHAEFIEFPARFRDGSSDYSAVDTIDPSGRVWFYSAYPYRAGWLNSDGTFADRELPFLPGWKIISWDDWREPRLVVADTRGHLRTFAVENFKTLQPKLVNGEIEFDSLIPVDLFNRDVRLEIRLYYDSNLNRFFASAKNRERMIDLGSFELSRPSIAVLNAAPDEFPMVWIDKEGGPCTILGLVDGHLLLWSVGRKEYTLLSADPKLSVTKRVPVQHVRPASISAVLSLENDGVLVTGFPTHGEIVLWQPRTDHLLSLGEPVRNLEGQVDWLVRGSGKTVYGGAYPNAVLFRMEPVNGPNSGMWQSTILWRSDSSGDTKHFQRVASLGTLRSTPGHLVAIVKSDYSDKKETALVIVARNSKSEKENVTVRGMRDFNLERLVSVHARDDGLLEVLGEDSANQWVLLTLEGDGGHVIRRTVVSARKNGRARILSHHGGWAFVYDGKAVQRIGIGEIIRVGQTSGGNIVAAPSRGKTVFIAGADHISCLHMAGRGRLETRSAVIDVQSDARKSAVEDLDQNRVAVWNGQFLVALSDSLFRLSLLRSLPISGTDSINRCISETR